MQAPVPELSAITGQRATPTNQRICAEKETLSVVTANLATRFDNVVVVSPEGRIDPVATAGAIVQYNEEREGLIEQVAGVDLATAASEASDAIVNNYGRDLLVAAHVNTWRSVPSPTSSDHPRNVGPYAVRIFQLIVRFGALTLAELYICSGTCYGAKNQFYGLQQLLAGPFLDNTARLGRRHLITLHPCVARFVPVQSVRAFRDPEVIAEALASGRAVRMHRQG